MINLEVFLITSINGPKEGSSGLAYFTLEKENNKIYGKGQLENFSNDACLEIMKISNAKIGDSIFFACGEKEVEKLLSSARDKIAKDLDLIDDNVFAFVGSLIIQCMK